MTWNPITLRRMLHDAETNLYYTAQGEERWQKAAFRAQQERDDLASQRDALMKQVQHLKQPRGPGGQFLGRK